MALQSSEQTSLFEYGQEIGKKIMEGVLSVVGKSNGKSEGNEDYRRESKNRGDD